MIPRDESEELGEWMNEFWSERPDSSDPFDFHDFLSWLVVKGRADREDVEQFKSTLEKVKRDTIPLSNRLHGLVRTFLAMRREQN
jgi:hypothetical protein